MIKRTKIVHSLYASLFLNGSFTFIGCSFGLFKIAFRVESSTCLPR